MTLNLSSYDIWKQFYGKCKLWEEKTDFEKIHLKISNLALCLFEELHKKLKQLYDNNNNEILIERPTTSFQRALQTLIEKFPAYRSKDTSL